MKRLTPAPLILALRLLLSACGGSGITVDLNFGDGNLPEGSHVEFTLGGTP